MNPRTRLTILFDCCHSGSAVELPYVYRPDENGEINLLDSAKQAVSLATGAAHLLQGGFSLNKMRDAEMLLGGAKTFFAGLQHRHDDEDLTEDGLGEEEFAEDWKSEGKDVWMFSGCRDDQTSADAVISGGATGMFESLSCLLKLSTDEHDVGAMSFAFLRMMRQNPQQSYINVRPPPKLLQSIRTDVVNVQVLQNTREMLAERYAQIPQLSVGGTYDLDQLVSV